MVRTVNTNSVNPSPPENSNNGWTTIPVKPNKPKPLVSFPKYPTEPTLHMLVLKSYFVNSTNKWIWHCYLDDEILTSNPRGRERHLRIQKAFTKSGTFFAERGIVLHSLNVSTPRMVELFFGSEEDLWKADALVQEYSQAMTGVDDRIRRMENTGKMVCHGVGFLEQFAGEFVGRWNLKEERLRELEDMNPVFYSTGKRWLYRIRYVHYMSSQSSSDHLWRNGSTWAVTFNDFRVAECFIDGYAEFNFFNDPCSGGLSWYQEGPFRSIPNPGSFERNSVPWNGGESVPGTAESSGVTAASTSSGGDKLIKKRLEHLVFGENPEEAASTLNLKGQNPTDLKVTSTGQHQESKIQSPPTATIAPVKYAPEQAVTKIDTTERQKPQSLGHLVKVTTTPANPAAINMNRYRKAKPKNQPPPGDDEGQFPPLPPPLSALLPQPLPPPTLPVGEPTATKITSGTLPDTVNKVSPPESSTLPTENVRPQPTERVKYQYAINAKRPAAKVSLPAKKSTPSGSAGGSSNSAPAAPASALTGQSTTTATATIAPGVGITTATTTTTTGNKDTPAQEALDKPRLRNVAARRRRNKRERKNAGKNAAVTTPATRATTDASTDTNKGGGADNNRQES